MIAGKITKESREISYICPSCGCVVKKILKPDERVNSEEFVRGDFCRKCSK